MLDSVLQEILTELQKMNARLGDIREELTDIKQAQGDDALRPSFDAPEWNALTDTIAAMAKAHRESRALCYGDFRQLVLTNRQCIWERCADGERVLIAVNIDDQPYTAHFDAKCGRAVDLITGEPHDFGGGSELPPCSAFFWKCER